MTEPVPIRVVADIVRHHAVARPDATAMVFEGRETSYRTLDRHASQVANGLIGAGIKPQARIAQLGKNADTFFELLFGTTKANCVLVSVNWRLAAPEVAYVINDAEAEMLFVDEEFFPVIEKVRDQLKTVRHIVALNGRHPGWQDFASWRDSQPETDPEIPVALGDTAIQLYTSGTTGHPKGAEITNGNLLALMPIAVERWGDLGPADVSLVTMPGFHIGGAGWGVVGLYAGANNIILREFNPVEILKAIERYRITVTLFVPAMILFLLQTPQIHETDLSSLREILYGAAPMPLDLMKAAAKVFPSGLTQVYGLTETTGAITQLDPEDHRPERAEKMKSCGKPYPGVEVRILDGAGKELPAGEVGEIVVRTPQVMKGYWKRPEANAQSIRDGWLFTGDAGFVDAEGYLYIHDRVKDMIVSGGENIYPAEVESALFGHPAIADVAVIGVPDDTWGESVKAIVVRKPGMEPSPAELIAFARERIAGYKVPRSIDFVEALPRNPTGKILKRELRKPYWEGRSRQVN